MSQHHFVRTTYDKISQMDELMWIYVETIELIAFNEDKNAALNCAKEFQSDFYSIINDNSVDVANLLPCSERDKRGYGAILMVMITYPEIPDGNVALDFLNDLYDEWHKALYGV